MAERIEIAESRRWVIKVGSALLTNDGRGLDEQVIANLVEQLVALLLLRKMIKQTRFD